MDNHTKNIFEYKKYKILERNDIAPETVLYKISGYIKHEPGQFFQIAVPHMGEATFAPCSDLSNTNYFEICVRAAGSTTNQMIKLLPGDTLDIRGPYGNSWPIGTFIGKNVILIIGGMGIVPLRPLIFELIKYKKEFKKIYILAGFKTPAHVLFNDDFISWKNHFEYVNVAVEKISSNWWGDKGQITEILKRINLDAKKSLVAMCGPDIMYKYVNEVLYNKEITDKQIFVSMERRMECGVGLCQHCNIGKYLVCKDGPVFRWDMIKGEIDK